MSKKSYKSDIPIYNYKTTGILGDVSQLPIAGFIQHFCRYFLWNSKDDVYSTDWIETNLNTIIDRCRQNRLFPFLYNYLVQSKKLDKLPPKIQDRLKNIERQLSLRLLKMSQVYSSVVDCFNNHTIQHITLKGIVLSQQIYENRVIRPMVDIDLLLPSDDIYKAADILKSELHAIPPEEGKRSLLPEYQHHIDPLMIDGIAVELHTQLFTERSGNKLNLNEVWTNAIVADCYNKPTRFLSNEYQIYHLATHAMQHFQRGNIRLLWFLDVASFIQKFGNKIDFSQCLLIAKNSNQEKQFIEALSLVQSLFKVDLPGIVLEELQLQYEKRNSKNIQHIIKHLEYGLLKVGAGFLIKDWLRSGNIVYKVRFIFKELFPPKQYMTLHYKIHGQETIKLIFFYSIRPILIVIKLLRMLKLLLVR